MLAPRPTHAGAGATGSRPTTRRPAPARRSSRCPTGGASTTSSASRAPTSTRYSCRCLYPSPPPHTHTLTPSRSSCGCVRATPRHATALIGTKARQPLHAVPRRGPHWALRPALEAGLDAGLAVQPTLDRQPPACQRSFATRAACLAAHAAAALIGTRRPAALAVHNLLGPAATFPAQL